MQQLPGFVTKAGELKAKGVSTVACINTYDVFVQDAWGKNQGTKDDVIMLSDSNAVLLKHLNMVQDLSTGPLPLGACISKRFVLILDDMKVTYVGLDEKGFEHSSVEATLAHL
ncbi:hypothetical protein HDU76_008508 [Blyttiomyces sp. JEL0837]|nr:hypothetical protein HDU76_008508 [Blyttiomyces sp. JEL0837]